MYTYEIDKRQETSPIAPALPTTAHRWVKPRIMRSAPGSSQYNRTARGAQVACPGRMLEPSSARWPRVASAMRTVQAMERARGFVARNCRIREPDAQHIAFLAHVELNVSRWEYVHSHCMGRTTEAYQAQRAASRSISTSSTSSPDPFACTTDCRRHSTGRAP